MLAPAVLKTTTPFAPLRDGPPVQLTAGLAPEGQARAATCILSLGSGDVRNVLYTRHMDEQRKMDITCCDHDKAIIARNILLVTLLIDNDTSKDASLWAIYHHMRLDQPSMDILSSQAQTLFKLSRTITTWSESKYGKAIKFCDAATLKEVRLVWNSYIVRMESDHTGHDRRLKASIDDNDDNNNNKPDDTRTRAPNSSSMTWNALHEHFWTHGVVDLDNATIQRATRANPTFLSANKGDPLHRDTNPIAGYLVLVKGGVELTATDRDTHGSLLDDIVRAARAEFHEWVASFRAHVGATVLRFYSGDALALAVTLQCARGFDCPITAKLYRRREGFVQLTLLRGDYGCGGTAPLSFDVIDTSTLSDSLGGLMVLTLTTALLRDRITSTLYTEVTPGSDGKLDLAEMLCGDVATVSSLLGLIPVEYWAGMSSRYYQCPPDDEATTEEGGSPNVFSPVRVLWRRPISVTGHPKPTLDSTVVEFRFEDGQLEHLLFAIYRKMFKDEDLPRSAGFAPAPKYNRASFAIFLKVVASRIKEPVVNKSMPNLAAGIKDYHEELEDDSKRHIQELFLWMALLSIIPPKAFIETFEWPATVHRGALGGWASLPTAVCVTIRVPSHRVSEIAETVDLSVPHSVYGALTGKPTLRDGPWQHAFSAAQIAIGHHQVTGSHGKESLRVDITEDARGWHGSGGSADLFVSFMAPAWCLVNEELHCTEVFVGSQGGKCLFETHLTDGDCVFLTQFMPNLKERATVRAWFLKNQKTEARAINGPDAEDLWGITPRVSKAGRFVQYEVRISANATEYVQALKENGTKQRGSKLNSMLYGIGLCQRLFSLEPSLRPLNVCLPSPVTRDAAPQDVLRLLRKGPNYLRPCLSFISDLVGPNELVDVPFEELLLPLFCTRGGKPHTFPWVMSHVNLDKLPIIDSVNLMRFASTSCSERECKMLQNTLKSSDGKPTQGEVMRLTIKWAVAQIFFPDCPKQAIILFEKDPTEAGALAIFPSACRKDLSSGSVVLDCAVFMSKKPSVTSFVKSVVKKGACKTIKIEGGDRALRIWRLLVIMWSEQCRGSSRSRWGHRSSCLLNQVNMTCTDKVVSLSCDCGLGVFPQGFLPNVEGWEKVARHAVRASISPLFSTPFS